MRKRPLSNFFGIPMNLRWLTLLLLLIGGSPATFGQLTGTNPVVRFHTDLGDIDTLLIQDVAPNTVANFLKYVRRGDYDNTFIHRSILNFVIQGGGFTFVNGQVVAIRQDAAVINEFHVSNTRGTLAMAKVAGNPNSATNQWFFNESNNNAANLDTQNGGFTVFGRIISASGLTTMDKIAVVPIDNQGPGFEELPLLNYIKGQTVVDANLVHVLWIKVVPQIVALTHPSANTIHVQGRGQPSTSYKLEMSATPIGSGFTTSVTVTTGTGGNFAFDDTTPGTKKFYRVTTL